MKGRALALALALLLSIGCGASQTPRAEHAAPRRPLVVTIVYDQLASWVLEAHYDRLDPEGAIRRTAARGRYVHRVEYPYGATYTAPGHAAIYSGAAPFESGIPSNRVWTRGARLSTLDDAEHAIFGHDGAFASPVRLTAETVGDVLEAETDGAAITVALGMKDRSAVLPGGHHPDACFWFDTRAGGFTTSTYYASALPAWLSSWQRLNPYADRLSPWLPEDPAMLAALGPDDQSGEGSYGWDRTFPHDARGQEDPDAFLSSPESSELLLALARETIARLHMGEDDVPDLLAISIASTDYIGHGYGPESWEYVDGLVRVDRAVGRFLAELEHTVDGDLGVLITADHGVAPLVERSHDRGHADAVRWTSEAELALLRAHLVETLGEGDWIEAWVQPYVYLSEHAQSDRERVVRAVTEHLAARPGVAMVFDAHDAATLRASSDPLRVRLGLGIPATPPGDVYVVPTEWSVAEEEMPPDSGTSHGSPWSYDREVPVIFAGPGVTPGELDEPGLSQRRVAGTIGRLLGIRPPEHAEPSL